jgi:acid phosphatase
MVVMMENKNYDEVIGQAATQPYTNALASTYGLATQSYAFNHPSLPNYLDLVSGSNQGVKDDLSPSCPDPSHCFPSVSTLADQLAAASVSEKAYAEGLPADPTNDSGGYAVRHFPWEYFPNTKMPIADASTLLTDLNAAAPPDFVWYTPNLTNDEHDGTVQEGDAFLSTLIPQIQATPWYKVGGQIIIEWDEAEDTDTSGVNGTFGGHVPTIVVSDALQAAPQQDATPVNTAGILASIEDRFGVSHLSAAADPANGNIGTLLDAAIPPASVTGNVTDASTGQTISGACVYLYQAGVSSSAAYATCTSASGDYSIGGIQPGSYSIAFTDPAGTHLTQWYNGQSSQATAATITLADGQTDSGLNAALPELTGLSGTVTDARSGVPLAGVCVYLYDAVTGSRNAVPGICSDSSGGYVLAAPAGLYKVAFFDPSNLHVTQWAGGVSSEATAATVTVVSGVTTGGANASMTEMTGVAGKVTDSSTGQAVSGVCVYPYSTSGVRTADSGTCTDANGNYVLSLGAGSYEIAFYDPAGKYMTQWANGQASQAGANTVTVTAGQTAIANAAMVGLGTLTGSVTQATSGSPAYAGVCVYLDTAPAGSASGAYAGFGACTDSSGAFTMSGIPPGTYKAGYYTPGQPQGAGAAPTGHWYNGAASEATATVITVTSDQSTVLVSQSLP